MVASDVRPDIALASGEFWGRNPHDELTWLRQHAPVYWDEVGQVWGVATYDLVRYVSKHPQDFSSAGGIRPETGPIPMMIDMDDPEHWNRRKLVNRGFTPKRVREQEPKVRSVVDSLIDKVCERGECDFVWDLAAWLPLVMIGDALGFEEADHPTLLQWSDDLLKGLGQDDPELLAKTVEAFSGYQGHIAKVIEDRRGCPHDDLISTLIQAEVDGHSLNDDDLLHESLLILIGGDETTRHVISGGAYQLLTTGQWEKLRDDRSLMDSAVEEMLRWVSPIKNMARTATHDLELAGQDVKEGQKLLLLYSSANRDETVFDDPFRFDIERTPNDHVAFGFGPHFCLGNSLARLELKVMFERLLDRLPDLQLATPDEPAHRPANFVSGYEGMKVTFTPSAPLGA